MHVIMTSKASPTLSKDLGQAKAFLEYWAKGSTQVKLSIAAPGTIPTASDADTSGYSALNKKAVQLVSRALKITQYFARDSRPGLACPIGMPCFLLSFHANPKRAPTNSPGKIEFSWRHPPPPPPP